MKKLSEKAKDKLVQTAYYASCSGIQINIMDISKVFGVGRRALDAGADEAALQTAIRAFVETIRQN